MRKPVNLMFLGDAQGTAVSLLEARGPAVPQESHSPLGAGICDGAQISDDKVARFYSHFVATLEHLFHATLRPLTESPRAVTNLCH